MSPTKKMSHARSRGKAARRSDAIKSYEPGVEEVLGAVESLYKDQLKPFGRILLKRLRERMLLRTRAEAAGFGSEHVSEEGVDDLSSVQHIDPKYLRWVCEHCSQLSVEPAEAREYAVLLKGWPLTFIDVVSEEDTYSEEIWSQFRDYFENLPDDSVGLPGGRYACAQVLLSRKLRALNTLSLGQVCHLVQLAVSTRKIIGYRQGAIVPYSRSEELVKEHCAANQVSIHQACTIREASDQRSLSESARSQELRRDPESTGRIATWSQVKSCLRAILETSTTPELGTITLSNVKRLFRSRFDLELSETALGHFRLCELLRDERLQDTCYVQCLFNGQAVVKLTDFSPGRPARKLLASDDAASSTGGSSSLHEQASVKSGSSQPPASQVPAPHFPAPAESVPVSHFAPPPPPEAPAPCHFHRHPPPMMFPAHMMMHGPSPQAGWHHAGWPYAPEGCLYMPGHGYGMCRDYSYPPPRGISSMPLHPVPWHTQHAAPWPPQHPQLCQQRTTQQAPSNDTSRQLSLTPTVPAVVRVAEASQELWRAPAISRRRDSDRSEADSESCLAKLSSGAATTVTSLGSNGTPTCTPSGSGSRDRSPGRSWADISEDLSCYVLNDDATISPLQHLPPQSAIPSGGGGAGACGASGSAGPSGKRREERRP